MCMNSEYSATYPGTIESMKEEILNSKSSRYPVCRLVNIIGEKYESSQDEEEKEEARKALINILSAEDKDIASVAFCYLVESLQFDGTEKDDEVLKATTEFEEKEKDTPHLNFANESMMSRGKNRRL